MWNLKRIGSLGAGLSLALWSGWLAADAESDYQRGLKAFEEENLILAMQSLGRAASAGHAKAQALLAYIHDKAEEDAQALRYYRMAADQGDPAGEFGLGTLYAAGEGVARDQAQALHWFQRAADQGYGPALEVLADAYLEGALGLEPDRETAIQLLRRAAAEGYEPARRKLETLEAGKDGA